MTKFASLKKIHKKIIIVKRNIFWNLDKKWFVQMYIGSFFKLFITLP